MGRECAVQWLLQICRPLEGLDLFIIDSVTQMLAERSEILLAMVVLSCCSGLLTPCSSSMLTETPGHQYMQQVLEHCRRRSKMTNSRQSQDAEARVREK